MGGVPAHTDVLPPLPPITGVIEPRQSGSPAAHPATGTAVGENGPAQATPFTGTELWQGKGLSDPAELSDQTLKELGVRVQRQRVLLKYPRIQVHRRHCQLLQQGPKLFSPMFFRWTSRRLAVHVASG